MDRRLFLTGLLGVAGTAALVTALPRSAGALTVGPLDDVTPQAGGILPELQAAEQPEGMDGVQTAWHRGRAHHRHHRRRRRVRRRHWRRVCRRYRNRWGHWARSCRRVPYWGYIWL